MSVRWKMVGLTLALVGMLGVGFAFAMGGEFLQTTANLNGNTAAVNNFDYWVEQGPGTFVATSILANPSDVPPASSSVSSPTALAQGGNYAYLLAGATVNVGDVVAWVAFQVPNPLPGDY